ncbi:MAG: DUF4351 domain-containing protein [Pseudomonadota bacterium]
MEGLVDQIREEGRLKGIEEGMLKGIQEGIERGRSQVVASLALRLLSRKFRRIDESTESRIRQLSVEDLERLSEDLLDFSDYSDLLEWLDRL